MANRPLTIDELRLLNVIMDNDSIGIPTRNIDAGYSLKIWVREELAALQSQPPPGPVK